MATVVKKKRDTSLTIKNKALRMDRHAMIHSSHKWEIKANDNTAPIFSTYHKNKLTRYLKRHKNIIVQYGVHIYLNNKVVAVVKS